MSEAESKAIFQSRFNELLSRHHVAQKEIALICHVSTSTVSTWSKGINMPRMDKIERLAEFFDVPKSYFIEENAPTPTDREIEDEDLKAAFFGGYSDDLSPEEIDALWQDAKDFMHFKAEQLKRKGGKGH